MTTFNYIRAVVCLSLIIDLLAYPTTASACSCGKPGLPAREFQKSNAVFTGKVLRIVDEYVPVFSTLDQILTMVGQQPYFWVKAGNYVGYRIYFGVNNSWKGVAASTVVVDTGYGMGDCGYPFVVSNNYLVYASYPNGIPNNYWVTSICSRSAEISAATEDLKYLTTLPALRLNRTIQIFGLPIGTAALLLVSLLIVVIIFMYTHKRRVLRWEE